MTELVKIEDLQRVLVFLSRHLPTEGCDGHSSIMQYCEVRYQIDQRGSVVPRVRIFADNVENPK